MKAISTWLFIAATILLGLASLSAKAQEFRLRVSTKSADGTAYYAVTSDRRLVGIVCSQSLARSAINWSAQYSADLVFPNDEGVLDLTSYRSTTPSRGHAPAKPAYRPLSSEDAKTFCDDPQGEYLFEVNDESALLRARRSINVQSFGVGRRFL